MSPEQLIPEGVTMHGRNAVHDYEEIAASLLNFLFSLISPLTFKLYIPKTSGNLKFVHISFSKFIVVAFLL